MVLGTVGYMSPEQVRGQPADHRVGHLLVRRRALRDALGQRAFRGRLAAETMAAILKEDPPELSDTGPEAVSPGLERIVRHCLEKNPEERAHPPTTSPSQLECFERLGTEPNHRQEKRSTQATASLRARRHGPRRRGSRRIRRRSEENRSTSSDVPAAHVSTRRDPLRALCAGPAKRRLLRRLGWKTAGNVPHEDRSSRSEEPFLPGADLLSISPRGEMMISLNRQMVQPFVWVGTLAQTSISGGVAPRELLEDVQCADWAPSGAAAAIVRDVDRRARLEYPAGRVVYQTQAWLSHPRVSPDGKSVAFIDIRSATTTAASLRSWTRRGRSGF